MPEGKSYSDILKVIKTQINPTQHGAKISGVRKTRTGDVLVELKEQKDKQGTLAQEIRKTLGEQVKVQDLVPKRIIQIRDLDCLTTEEEVREAIKTKEKDAEISKITISASNGREQRAAYVEIDEKTALKLIRASKLHIGWMNCRVRLRTPLTRCFRCLGFGHLAAECKGPNRKDRCYRCGAEGHIAAGCKAKVKCMLCVDLGLKGKEVRHDMAKGECEALRRALLKRKDSAGSKKKK